MVSRRENAVIRNMMTTAAFGLFLAFGQAAMADGTPVRGNGWDNIAADPGEGVRIKDIATFEGVRENQLIGYGLVVGLAGTGDSLRNSAFTRQSIEGMLDRMGVGNLSEENLRTENTAAVMVTARLPAFSRLGSPIDIEVSSLGDASSLRGGTLLVTPLLGADGEVYAVGQGPLSVGGYAIQGEAASVSEGVPTAARIENGAIVEQEIAFDLAGMESFRIALRNVDATTAGRVAARIQQAGFRSRMLDPGTIEVARKEGLSIPLAMMEVEQLRVTPDVTARVVIDSKSGTIVIGSDVRISPVAISQGGLTVAVSEGAAVSQPESFSVGGTVVVPSTEIQVTRRDSGFALLDGPVSLRQLVDGLNAIGLGASETISILQAIKASGALHADLEVI